MDAPPTPVSPTMGPPEMKEKKRKRDKHSEKSAKKQKRESAAATDSRVEDSREADRAERKKKRKEKKSKSHETAQSNGVEDVPAQNPEVAASALSGDHVMDETQAVPDAREAELERHSPFIQQTTSLYLPLSPCASTFPLEGLLAEHVSPLLLTYYPPLKGVLFSYSNARLSEHPHVNAEERDQKVLSQCINEYAVTFTWLTADFLLFRPRRGMWLEGYVRLGNESMIGLVCYNYFNAVIERERMPSDWTWEADGGEIEEQKGRRRGLVESAGFFRDGQGKKVEGRLVFRVEDFDALQGDAGGSVSIMGTLLPEKDGM